MATAEELRKRFAVEPLSQNNGISTQTANSTTPIADSLRARFSVEPTPTVTTKANTPIADELRKKFGVLPETPTTPTAPLPFEATKLGIATETIKGIPQAAKELLFPARGYTEEQLAQSKPGIVEAIKSVPKIGAEIASGIGELASRIPGVGKYGEKLLDTGVGSTLASAGKIISDFAQPKTVGEAKAMRLADIVSVLPAGIAKSFSTSIRAISKTEDVAKIADELAQMGIKKEVAPQLAETLKNITDENTISGHITEALKTAHTDVPIVSTKVVPEVTPKVAIEPILGEKTYSTIHEGGVVKMVQGEPVKIVDGVDTFAHKGDGGWVISEESTGKFIAESQSKEGAIAKAHVNINEVGKDKFMNLIAENKLPATAGNVASDILTQEARKYKSAEEFVGAQGDPTYQHRMLRESSEADLEKIKTEGFDSNRVEEFNRPPKPFHPKFSKQPNVTNIETGRGQFAETKKGEIVLLPPKEVVIDGKNGPFIKPGWIPKESEIVRIKYDGQSPAEAYKSQLTDIWNKAQETPIAPLEKPGMVSAPGEVATRQTQQSIQGEIPKKEALQEAGISGVVSADKTFSKELDNQLNSTTRANIEQELAPTMEKNPAKLPEYLRFKEAVANAWDYMRESVQDDMLRVKKLVENPDVKITDASDPYQAEINFHGRVGTRLEEAKTIANEIDKSIIDIAKTSGLDSAEITKDVNRFLIARHAPERNTALGARAAGMNNEEAKAILEEINAKKYAPEVKIVAEKIQELNNKTLDVLLEGGVIDKDLFNTLRNKYKNHIPLNRIFEGEEDFGSALGKGFDVRSTGIKKAVGSEREVADILGNVVSNYEQAVIRAEKNRVDLSTLKMVRDNADILGDTFKIRKPKAIGQTFDGKPLMEVVTDPQTLVMRENGKPILIEISDKNLASALKGISRDKLSGPMRGVAAITRFYSGLQTRFNPEFAFANKVRDIQEVMVYAGAQGELGAKGAAKILAREAKLENERAVLDFIRGKDTEGAKLYKQMKEDGGTTGGLGLSTRSQVEVDIEEIRKINRSKPRLAAKKIIDTVDQWNTIFEDSTRLSVYREALKNGASRDRAARLAKEASVNFNKMGKYGPLVNSLYMFSNASIQGSAKMLMAMKNPKVAGATIISVVAPVVAVNEWNDSVDPDWRAKVTTWDRLNSLPIMIPSEQGVTYFTIPVSWGLKPIKVMADQISDLSNGKGEGIANAMGAVMVSVLEGYNPIGGTDLVSAITPTVLDMPVDIARNQSWNGGKIRPDWDKYAPEHIQYFQSLDESTTGKSLIGISKGLSGIGIEVSPADMNYVLEQLIGGAGRSIKKTVDTVSSAAKLQMPETRDIPFVSRFLKTRTQEEVGAGTDEYDKIKKVLANQSVENFVLKQNAEDSYQQLKNLPKDEAKKRWQELYKADKILAKKVADIATAEKKNLNYTDRMVLELGVSNMNRAQYLVTKFNELKTKEEKATLWKDYVEKGILTKEVQKQVTQLLFKQKNEKSPSRQ